MMSRGTFLICLGEIESLDVAYVGLSREYQQVRTYVRLVSEDLKRGQSIEHSINNPATVVSVRMTRGGLSYITMTLPAGPTTTASSAPASATTTTTTVLFAHANGFCKECFIPLWDELAALTRALSPSLSLPVRLLAFDLSGHGDSGPVTGPDCDWRRVAARDVKAMLEEVGDQGQGQDQGCCLGVGHSLVCTLDRSGLCSLLYVGVCSLHLHPTCLSRHTCNRARLPW